MTIFPLIISVAITFAVLFAIIYISYLLVARKQCAQREILRTSAALTSLGFLLGLLGTLLNAFLPTWSTQLLTNVAFIILQYRYGIRWLRLSRKRAFLAVCISIGLLILLIGGMIAMLASGH